jgi:hypothetical protein
MVKDTGIATSAAGMARNKMKNEEPTGKQIRKRRGKTSFFRKRFLDLSLIS